MADEGDPGQTGGQGNGDPKAGEGNTDPSSGGETRTLSQAEVDAIVEQRLSRERQKYADYKDLKAKAAKYDELEDSQKSELQKLTEQIAERDQQLEQLRQDTARQAATSALMAAATKAGVVDPEAAAQLIGWEKVNPDEKGGDPESLVAQLVEAKPYLKGRMGSADNGARGGAGESEVSPGLERLIHAYSRPK